MLEGHALHEIHFIPAEEEGEEAGEEAGENEAYCDPEHRGMLAPEPLEIELVPSGQGDPAQAHAVDESKLGDFNSIDEFNGVRSGEAAIEEVYLRRRRGEVMEVVASTGEGLGVRGKEGEEDKGSTTGSKRQGVGRRGKQAKDRNLGQGEPRHLLLHESCGGPRSKGDEEESRHSIRPGLWYKQLVLAAGAAPIGGAEAIVWGDTVAEVTAGRQTHGRVAACTCPALLAEAPAPHECAVHTGGHLWWTVLTLVSDG